MLTYHTKFTISFAYKLRLPHSKPIKLKINRILLSLRSKMIVAKMKLLSPKNETIIFRTTANYNISTLIPLHFFVIQCGGAVLCIIYREKSIFTLKTQENEGKRYMKLNTKRTPTTFRPPH